MTAHRKLRRPVRRRLVRFVRRWWRYWLRMSLIGLATGILLAGLYNASPTQFNHPVPTRATPTSPRP